MSIYNQKYSSDLFTNPNTSFSKIVSFLPSDPKYVLDVGCSSGFLGKYVKTFHSCHYTGVDFDKHDLKLASKILDHTVCLDLESQSLSASLFTHKFDVVILADILEHLRSPEKVLNSIHSLITPNSTIVISVPNIVHQSIIISLLQRQWQYHDTGILDKTHVKFFSKESISKTINDSGFKIIATDHTTKPEKLPLLLKPLRLYLNHPDFLAYQYIIKAIPKS